MTANINQQDQHSQQKVSEPDEQNHALVWARRATLVAIFVAVTLFIAKLIAWIITGSAAVLGSLADSGLDLFGSLVAASAVRYAATPPDDNHRFGHHKAEALTSIAQVALLTASASLVAWESTQRLFTPEPIHQPAIAIGVLAMSLLFTLCLVTYQTLALRRSSSLIIEGDRAHYTGDIIANGGALFAVTVGVYFSFPQADAIAGLLAAVFLYSAAWKVGKQAIPQLMDEELPEADKAAIKAILQEDSDVQDFHALRTRKAGELRFIQVDIQIDPDLSFREAHDITDRIELAIEEVFPDADVIVHPDPAGEARIERRVAQTEQDGLEREELEKEQVEK